MTSLLALFALIVFQGKSKVHSEHEPARPALNAS